MDLISLVHECAPWVAPQTMAAIIKTESEFRPYAIGVNDKRKLTRQPKTKAEAVSTANWLIANGYNIDLGLGQVNSTNLKKYNLSVEDAFEPCRNIATAATILKQNYQTAIYQEQDQKAALYAALSAYNTGSFKKGFKNGYVYRVVNNAGKEAPEIIVPAINPSIPEPQSKEQIAAARAPEQTEAPVKVQPIEEKQNMDEAINVYQPQNEEREVMVY